MCQYKQNYPKINIFLSLAGKSPNKQSANHVKCVIIRKVSANLNFYLKSLYTTGKLIVVYLLKGEFCDQINIYPIIKRNIWFNSNKFHFSDND